MAHRHHVWQKWSRFDPGQFRDLIQGTVPQNAPLAELAHKMIGGRVHRLIVTEGNRVVGIVTTLDILRSLRDSRQGI